MYFRMEGKQCESCSNDCFHRANLRRSILTSWSKSSYVSLSSPSSSSYATTGLEATAPAVIAGEWLFPLVAFSTSAVTLEDIGINGMTDDFPNRFTSEMRLRRELKRESYTFDVKCLYLDCRLSVFPDSYFNEGTREDARG